MDKQWAYDTWATADFGDLRLSARAVEIGAAAMSSYEKSIPDRCETWAATKATYVVRARHNRKVGTGRSSQEGLLHFARALDSIGSRIVQMRSREDHPGKEINLQYAAAAVTLPVPDGVLGSPIAMNVVRIWGDDVEWILLTSRPAETLEQLQRIGDFYQHRWVIEEYHKSLKSGLNVEDSQLRTAPRIANLVGFHGVIASLLLVLRDQARSNPGLPASEFVSDTVISLVRRAHPKVPPNPSIRDRVRAIASMGGFLCWKGDGEPGWTTLWRGWNRIRHYLEFAA